MVLSRLFLDPTRQETLRALASPSRIHGYVESAFSGERQHPLWRVDTLNGQPVLLVLSQEAGDFTQAAEALSGQSQWESAPYERLLARVHNGTLWRFRLTANPTKSLSQPADAAGEKPRGRVVAHITPKHQEAWLREQAAKRGFALGEQVQVTSSGWKTFRKANGHRVTLYAATFEGLLTVTDEELFRETLKTGIGRGKAYGMGLLTLVRPTDG